MLKAYIRNNILYLRPASERDVDELRNWARQYKTKGSAAIDVDYEPMNYTGSHHEDDQYHDHNPRDYGRSPRQTPAPHRYNPYGYGPQSYRDFPPEPQSHYPFPPIILPIWLDRDRDGRRDYDPRDRDYDTRVQRAHHYEDEPPHDEPPVRTRPTPV